MDALAAASASLSPQELNYTFACALKEDVLSVYEFSVHEELFGLYEITLALSSPNPAIDLTQMMDKPARLMIEDRSGVPRYFHGTVIAAEQGDVGTHRTLYSVTLAPDLYRMRLGTDCRIFQDINVPDIIATLLREHGVSEFEQQFYEPHALREYCVQYNEDHLSFIERLMADEGIYYYFEHTEGGVKLIMADHSLHSHDTPNAATLEYNPRPGGGELARASYVRRFTWRNEVRTTEVSLKDYTFHNPQLQLNPASKAQEPKGHAANYQVFRYPGRFKSEEIGRDFARRRLDAIRAESSHGMGEGRCQHLAPGKRVSLSQHDNPAFNTTYLTVSVTHRGSQPQALEEEAGDRGTHLATSFKVVPFMTPWRPAPRLKPLIEGPQIGIVSGPANEEIYTDEHGRIKVQFPWDRYGKNDEGSSCWIRVAQAWAGPTFGTVAIPRIGQEVIVDHQFGDPDQPIVVGRTYHASNQNPYGLPDHKTKMAFRSNTHKGDGYNELSFEDENGQENMFLHAQKDQTIKVLNNQTSRVDANALQTIGANQAVEVGANVQQQVGGGKTVMIGAVGQLAQSLLGPALQGLMGQSAGMLQNAMEIAEKLVKEKGGAAGGDGAPESGTANGAPTPEPATAAGGMANALGGAAMQAAQGMAGAALQGALSGDMKGAMKGAAMGAAQGMAGQMIGGALGGGAGGGSGSGNGAGGGMPGGLMSPGQPGVGGTPPFVPQAASPAAQPSGGAVGSGTGNPADMLAKSTVPLHAAPADIAQQKADAAQYASILGGGILGMGGADGGGIFDLARQGINAAAKSIMRLGGGASMADAGQKLADTAAGAIGGGILNQVVGKYQNETVGIARTEQIGTAKVVNVGHVSIENVGGIKQLTVTDRLVVKVGESMLVMDKDGSIWLKGLNILIEGDEHIQHVSKIVDLN